MGALAANAPERIAGLSATAARLLGEAARALAAQRLDEADRVFAGVLALAPRHPEVLRLLGVLRQQQGRTGESLNALREAAALRPGDALIRMNLGSALRASGDRPAALGAFREACALAPDLAPAWFNLGKALKADAQTAAALEALEHAARLAPDQVGMRVILGDTLKQAGRIAEAAASYRAAIALQPAAGMAWHGLANLKTVVFTARETAGLRDALDLPAMPAHERIAARFALAKALDDSGDPAGAFTELATANAAMRARLAWDARGFSAHIDAIAAAFRPAPQPAPDPHLGADVVFIVSLPRSGSSLTEQILAAHRDIEGAGELPDLPAVIDEESARRDQPFPAWVPQATAADWERLGRRYLQRTRRWRDAHPRFTDKGLDNWPLVGAALAMLPAARVVICRRDPLEMLFSIWRQWFAQGHAYSYALEDLVACWRDFERLSRFWECSYPEAVLDHGHEHLLANPEAQIRRLLEFCRLPFDPACLRPQASTRAVRTASAAQVREPLRQSGSHAARYGTLLDPLRSMIAAGLD